MKRSKTREKIVQEAQKLFVEKGYKATSVRDICARAQVNISAISYYFSGKRNLYKACLEDFGQETLECCEALFEMGEDAAGQGSQAAAEEALKLEQRLEAFALRLMEGYDQRPELVKLVLKEFSEDSLFIDDPGDNPFAKIFESLAGYFARAQKLGVVDSTLEPTICASMLLGCLAHSIGFDDQRKTHLGLSIRGDRDYRKEYAKHITTVFCRGIVERLPGEQRSKAQE